MAWSVLTESNSPFSTPTSARSPTAAPSSRRPAASELFTALEHVLTGRFYITPRISTEPSAVFVERAQHGGAQHDLSLRQREVLQLLAEGRSMKEAADILKLATSTIAFHKYTMMRQLGFTRGAELVQYAVQLGLVGSAPDQGSAGRNRKT